MLTKLKNFLVKSRYFLFYITTLWILFFFSLSTYAHPEAACTCPPSAISTPLSEPVSTKTNDLHVDIENIYEIEIRFIWFLILFTPFLVIGLIYNNFLREKSRYLRPKSAYSVYLYQDKNQRPDISVIYEPVFTETVAHNNKVVEKSDLSNLSSGARGYLLVKILFTVLILLIVAQGFNGSLNISTFEKLYLNSLGSSYQVVGRDLKRNIESALRFGKPLEQFVGIEPLLHDVQKNNPDLENVSVSLPNGNILYSLDKTLVGSHLGEYLVGIFSEISRAETTENISVKSKSHDVRVALLDNNYHVLLALEDSKRNIIGIIDFTFKQELIHNKVTKIIYENLEVLKNTTLIAGLIIFLFLYITFSVQRKVPSRFWLYIFLFLILGGAQLFYANSSINLFRDNYLDIIRSKSHTLTKILQEDVEFLLQKGIRIDRLIRIDVLMSEIIAVTPEIDNMSILDADKRLLYFANTQGVVNIVENENKVETQIFSHENIDLYEISYGLHKNNVVEGYIRVQLSPKVIERQIESIILDALTVVVISFLFMMELVIFLLIFINYQIQSQVVRGSLRETISFGIARPAAFIYVFSASFAYSFIPLYMEELYQPLFGWSKDFVLGLPISAEMFAAGIALLPVGVWIDRRGWHEPFIIGVLLSMVGSILSGLATTAGEFILYRGIMGLGYGFAWMSVQGFVLSYTTVKTRARGISNLVAGIFSGTICGGAVGAMLAQQIGYANVFIVATIIMMFSLLFAFTFMRDFFVKPVVDSALGNQLNSKLKDFFRFLFNRNVALILMCSLVPYAVCMVGMLYYISPLYLKRIGTAQADIGRVLMIFGLCMIYIAPIVSRWVDKIDNKKDFVSLGGLMGGCSMLIFYFYDGFWAVFFAILTLGLSVSVSATSRNVLMLNLAVCKEIGMAKVMGVYRSVDKLGQMMGPILLGLLVVTVDMEKAVGVIGIIYLVVTLFFIVGVRQEKQKVVVS